MWMLVFAVNTAIFASDRASNASMSSQQTDDRFYDALSDGEIDNAAMLFGLSPQLKSELDPYQQTYLHLAVQNNFPAASVAFLINNGWDVNAQDVWGKTPWMYAFSEPFDSAIISMFFDDVKKINLLLEDLKRKNIVDYAKKYIVDYAKKYNSRWADKIAEHIKYLQNKKEAEAAQKYFATLPDPLNNENIELNNIAQSRKQSSWIRSGKNPSILIHQMPQKEELSELTGVDWALDKKLDSEVWQMGRLDDKERKLRLENEYQILQKIGQYLQDGAGI